MYEMKKNQIIKTLVPLFIVAMLAASISVSASTYELTVETDKSQYLQGETVYVTTRLTEDGVGLNDTGICYGIFDPNGTILTGSCGLTNNDGYLNFSYVLEPDAMFGTYDVNVTAHDYQLETHAYFEVVSEYDHTPPTIEITKPHQNMLYIFNTEVLQIGFAPICIGPIDIEVNATDTQSGVQKVEFYIDDGLVSTDTTEPYVYKWSSLAFLQHNISVVAFDNAGNSKSEEMFVWKFF